jgi:hypothetical protein
VRRLLVALVVALAAAPAAGATVRDFGATVSVTPTGNGQYVATIQNTDTTGPLDAFTFVPGAGLKVTGVVRSDVGSCSLTGTTFTCTGLGLIPAQCMCVLGGIVNVTFTGSGDGSGSTIAPAGTMPPPAAGTTGTAQATAAATASTQAGTAALAVVGPKTLSVSVARPTLTLTAKLDRARTLTVTLLDAGGHTVAHWSKQAAAGTSKLALLVPAAARQAGRHQIRVAAAGATTRTLSVVFRA